ncbi:hypothetical protein AMTR_s00243p00014580 [Amborella trichopoda]|uniref:Uncharacterized protein n=1 Tax=Amborella trichopoda TaxID=13333 RepID=W1NRV3_AMBTC|nr:hypothetical protein AMTR_s00243p00014580 [Amborella trichopoda]
MHDVMRAFPDSKEGPKFLVRAGAAPSEAPEANKWQGVERVSLMKYDIKDLPELPKGYPKLVTLLLQYNEELKTIPSTNFFQDMDQLSVLVLRFTNIESLPHSLSPLVNLQVLRLSDCSYLRELPPIGGPAPTAPSVGPVMVLSSNRDARGDGKSKEAKDPRFMVHGPYNSRMDTV